MKRMSLLFVAFVAGFLLCAPPWAAAQDKKTYTLAVVPQARSVEVIEKWTPFMKKLSQDLGFALDIIPYNSLSQFESDLQSGKADFVFMNPYEAASVAKGYTVLVRDKSPLVGIIVARKGGAVQSVKDLNGKDIAFPAPNAFAASLYIRALLTEREKISFKPQYVKTHGNVYRAVVFQQAAGGGGVRSTLGKEPDDITGNLSVIFETPGTAAHPFAAHQRVPEALRKRVAKAILAMGGDPASKSLLSNIQMPDPVEAEFQRDYQPLKKLSLEKYISKED